MVKSPPGGGTATTWSSPARRHTRHYPFTGWLGWALRVLFLAELVTLLDVRGLISCHLARACC